MTLLEQLQTEKLAKEKQLNELEAELKSLQEQLARLKVTVPPVVPPTPPTPVVPTPPVPIIPTPIPPVITPPTPVEAEAEVPRWRKYLPYIIGGGIVSTIIYLIFKK